MPKGLEFVISAKDKTVAAWKKASGRVKAFNAKIKNLVKGFERSTRAARKMASSVSAGFKKMGGAVAGIGKGIRNVFLGVGAGIAVAMVRAQEFNKQIGQVATLTDISMTEAKKKVRELSAEFGLAKDELTKGLYDALSAGVPANNVFDFMRTVAKAAIAGASTTAEAVDILTTTLNAFQIPATKAEQTADTLFTTVRLGKTTLAELSASLAQVAPLASASGVRFEEVAAAIATLTKQGTKTPMAMTQIRAAIIAMNKELGDGWAKTMTLQEGMQAMSDKAGGSAEALKALTGRVEGTLGILGLTGKNAKMAAEDLAAMGASAGAMGAAFEKMAPQNPIDRLVQSLDNLMRTVGDAAILAFGDVMNRIAQSSATLAESISSWTQSASFERVKKQLVEMADTAKGLVAAFAEGGQMRAKAVESIGGILGALLGVAGEKLVLVVKKAAPEIGKLLRAGFGGIFGAGDTEGIEVDTTGLTKAEAKLKQALADAGAVASEGLAAGAETDTERAIKALEDMQDKYAQQHAEKLQLIEDEKQAKINAIEAEEKAADEAAAKAKKDTEERIKKEKELADIRQKIADEDRRGRIERAGEEEKGFRAEAADLEKQIAGIATTREQRREQERAKREAVAIEKRAAELEARQARGVKLGVDDAAFLKARALEAKRLENIQNAEARAKKAQEERDKAAQDARDAMLISLKNQEKALVQNLQAAGG